jgi:hypothetical protein
MNKQEIVKTLDNFITDEDIAWFKQDWEKYFQAGDYETISATPSDVKLKWGLDNWDVKDRRRKITSADEAWSRVERMIHAVIPKDVHFWVAYQRQYIPHSMHIDEPSENANPDWLYSVIVPLDAGTADVAQTVVWDKQFNKFREYLDFQHDFIYHPEKYTKIGNTSELHDVDHCRLNVNPADYIPLAGVYQYKLGTAGMFPRCNLHCSSNWRKHNLAEYKDIIVYHIG